MTTETYNIAANTDDAACVVDESAFPTGGDTQAVSAMARDDQMRLVGLRFLDIGTDVSSANTPVVSNASIGIYTGKNVTMSSFITARTSTSPPTFGTTVGTNTAKAIFDDGTGSRVTWRETVVSEGADSSPDITPVIQEWFDKLSVGSGADLTLFLHGDDQNPLPTIASTDTEVQTVASTTIDIPRPTPAPATGDRMYILVADGEFTSDPTDYDGLTVWWSAVIGSSVGKVWAFSENPSGSETDPMYTLTFADSAKRVVAVLVLESGRAVVTSGTSTAVGTSTSPDPPAQTTHALTTESAGGVEVCWLGFDGNDTITSPPTGFTTQVTAASTDVTAAFATRNNTTPDDTATNPGAWTLPNSVGWRAGVSNVFETNRTADFQTYDNVDTNEPSLTFDWVEGGTRSLPHFSSLI